MKTTEAVLNILLRFVKINIPERIEVSFFLAVVGVGVPEDLHTQKLKPGCWLTIPSGWISVSDWI